MAYQLWLNDAGIGGDAQPTKDGNLCSFYKTECRLGSAHH